MIMLTGLEEDNVYHVYQFIVNSSNCLGTTHTRVLSNDEARVRNINNHCDCEQT